MPVRAQIGYGGGDYTVANGLVIFASPGQDGAALPAQPGCGPSRARSRRPMATPASPALSADGQWVAYVWSDGKTDLLALVDAQGRDWPVKLLGGSRFLHAAGLAPIRPDAGLGRVGPSQHALG